MEPSEVAELLEQLSEQLSPVAQHTFELIKTQMVIEAVVGSIFAGIGLVIAIVLSIIAVRVWTNGDHRYATDGEMFLLFGTILVWIVLLVTVLMSVGDVVTRLFNPEWAAIQYLFDTVNSER
jgi:Ca2+/Na+ antiporter